MEHAVVVHTYYALPYAAAVEVDDVVVVVYDTHMDFVDDTQHHYQHLH